MNQYIITYLGGDQPSSPEEGQKNFAKYQEWLSSLGEVALKPMVPFKNTHTVNPDGSVAEGSSVNMTGHTIIQAGSIEQAIEYAKSCPFLAINGSLEVAELAQM
ncbi:MAG: hypothetical protein ABFS45_06585 [Pseudomonadota bacterium]